MTTKRTRKPKAKPPAAPSFTPNRAFPLKVDKDATQATNAQSVAAQILAPEAAAYRVIRAAEGNGIFSEIIDTAGVLDHLHTVQAAVNGGNLAAAEAMLIAQATALQSLSARLIEKATSQEWLPQFECYMKLGLRAQRQSCLSIEALGALKHGPAIMARLAQVNIANGAPQQVNNTPPAPALPAPPPALTRADGVDFEIPQSKLLVSHGGEEMDPRATRSPGGGDMPMEALGAVHRPKDGRGKKPRRAKSR
jgi:hypothetical protein